MRPLFTVHAGEYLVGSFIEEHYPRWKVWIPSKDTGIDLLITDARNAKAVSLQVKFSKDFNPTHRTILLQSKLTAAGWWTHQETKIKDSKADFWVFVLSSFTEHQTHFIIIQPTELLRRFRAIRSNAEKRIHSYLWVTKSQRCWEARGLNNADQEMIAFERFSDSARDFTQYLDAWAEVGKKLKGMSSEQRRGRVRR
jgi:hypothetical protein